MLYRRGAVRQVVSRDVDADNDSVAAVADGAPNALVAVPVDSEATANAKAKANKGRKMKLGASMVQLRCIVNTSSQPMIA